MTRLNKSLALNIVIKAHFTDGGSFRRVIQAIELLMGYIGKVVVIRYRAAIIIIIIV